MLILQENYKSELLNSTLFYRIDMLNSAAKKLQGKCIKYRSLQRILCKNQIKNIIFTNTENIKKSTLKKLEAWFV